MIESMRTDFGKTKAELEQEKKRCTNTKEKLNMAVAKGKALVQNRDALRHQLSEKTTELENRLTELQEKKSALETSELVKGQLELSLDEKTNELEKCYTELHDKSVSLETYELTKKEVEQSLAERKEEVDECLMKLHEMSKALDESEIIKGELVKSNAMVSLKSSIIETIETILTHLDIPEGQSFDTIEKVKSLAEERKELKNVSQEYNRLKDLNFSIDLPEEISQSSLETRLTWLRDSFSQAKDEVSAMQNQIEGLSMSLSEEIEEKNNLRSELGNLTFSLERTKELEIEHVAIKDERDQLKQSLSLSDTMLQNVMKSVETMSISVDLSSEDPSEKIDQLTEYVKKMQLARAEEQEELEKVKEEASTLASKLAETHTTLKVAEDALSTAEGNIDRLGEGNRKVQAAKENVELELQKAVGEASSLASELDETYATRNTLEAALMQAEKNISDIISEKEEAQSRSATTEMELELVQEEVSNQNNKLTAAHSSIKALEKTLTQTQSNMESLSKQIEDDKVVITDLKNELDKLKNEAEFERGKMADVSLTIRSLEEAVTKPENSLSALQGEMMKAEVEIATLSSKLNVCMEELAGSSGNSQSKSLEIILGHNDSLKEQVRSEEGIVHEQENTISALQRDLSSLIDVCGETASKLQLEVKNDLLELIQFQEHVNGGEIESTEHPHELHVIECAQRVKELSFATEKACTTLKLFETTSNAAAAVIKDASAALEKVVLERDLNHTKVSGAEAKVASTEQFCQDLKLQLERLKAHEKEAELSILYDKLSVQEQESKETLIPATDLHVLFDKINGIEVPSAHPVNSIDLRNSYDVKKTFAIVDSVTEMQISGLKVASEAKSIIELELVKAKTDLANLISGLEKLLGILTSTDPVVDPNFSESCTILQTLERKITSLLLESESSKSRAQELGLKLAGSEKLVEILSLKVKELEEKLQSKAIQPDVNERSIFEAPSTSDISEIEDRGALGKSSISHVPAAAQVRTVRKGSTDHLSINIDSESEHLMNHNETDEDKDKGHVFKSLNMSGLIPTQGKMIADRVDGIWVSGGRVLMSCPQSRLGLMVYSLFLHLWLLASIL